LIRDTRIFELDTYATQHHKRGLLEQAQVVVPPQLTFVAIDFNQDPLAEALSQAGYTNTKQTLFLWEGVSYYLPPQTVEDTFSFVRRDALAGTIICFDYMLPTLDLENRFGAKQAREAMQGLYTAEPLQFDLAEEQLTTFLAERGFELIDHLTAEDMQARYLTLSDGSLAGRMLDLFRLVQARVTTEG
ncbi:MAG: SAM-dependent methyltransferase, partial [Anaerolineae bacterium]|nr:SAM-dependent methyltransferase [Anaerolineae bacterium]